MRAVLALVLVGDAKGFTRVGNDFLELATYVSSSLRQGGAVGMGGQIIAEVVAAAKTGNDGRVPQLTQRRKKYTEQEKKMDLPYPTLPHHGSPGGDPPNLQRIPPVRVGSAFRNTWPFFVRNRPPSTPKENFENACHSPFRALRI